MVNIDRVYQRVLVLVNKEQRGYITPQEFNLLANHAQMDIFEQYFYDLNQFRRLNGNDTIHSDMVTILQDKISFFEYWAVQDNVTVLNKYGDVNLENDIPDLYRIGEVSVKYPGISGHSACEQVSPKQFSSMQHGKLIKQTKTRPVFVKYNNNYERIKIYPYPVNADNSVITTPTKTAVRVDYIRKPVLANWGFTVVGGTALYNQNNSQHFELHPSEETELVIKILTLAGIVIKDPNLYNIGTGEDNKNIQQEKQ